MSLNPNIRAPHEYRLVTDGEQLYKLAPNFKIPKGVIEKIPKGLIEVFTHFGKKVYASNGRLKPQFNEVQRIQPRNNPKPLVLAIRSALIWWNHAN